MRKAFCVLADLLIAFFDIKQLLVSISQTDLHLRESGRRAEPRGEQFRRVFLLRFRGNDRGRCIQLKRTGSRNHLGRQGHQRPPQFRRRRSRMSRPRPPSRAETSKVPAETVVEPVNELLFPERVSVPVLSLMSEPAPVIAPERVWLAQVSIGVFRQVDTKESGCKFCLA